MSPGFITRKFISKVTDGGTWPDCDSWEAPGIVGFERVEGKRSLTAMAAGTTERKYESRNPQTCQHNGGGGTHPTNQEVKSLCVT